MFLFARSTVSSIDLEDGGSGRIYSVKIWDGDTLIRDMKPYIRKSDNVAGLYDFVNDVFYTNYGSGNFTYEVYENPYDRLYTKLEYIESTGTQYIDTNYYLNSNDIKIKTKVYTQDMPTGEQNIIGNQDSMTGRFILGLYNKYIFGYSRNGSKDDNVVSETFNGANIFDIEVDYNYSTHIKQLTVNGNTTTSNYNNTISNSNVTVKLLRGADDSQYYFIGRLYYLQLFNGDYLIRNFVPAVRNSDNAVGLYDEVYDVFYTNSGTGEFIKGEL